MFCVKIWFDASSRIKSRHEHFCNTECLIHKAQGRNTVTSVEVWNEHSYKKKEKEKNADCEERFGISEEIKYHTVKMLGL